MARGDYRFFQIAWIVDDLQEAMANWTKTYGVGPFYMMPKRTLPVTYRGREMEWEMRLAATQAGPVEIELIEQIPGVPNIYSEVFPNAGGGFHHFCALTKRFDETKAHYESLGFPSILQIHSFMRIEYFDTYKAFGHMTELVEYTPSFVASHSRMSRACENWDGKDPVRMHDGEGYVVPDLASV